MLPAATDSLYVDVGTTLNTLPGTQTISLPNANDICVSACSGFATASAAFLPSVTVSASCLNCQIGYTSIYGGVSAATALLNYSFEIAGPSSEQVPVIFNYNVAGTATPLTSNANAVWGIEAEVLIYTPSNFGDQFNEASADGDCEYDNEFLNGSILPSSICSGFAKSGQTELSVMSNTVYSIAIDAGVGLVSNASALVSVDPSIQVDPTFSDSNLFSVQVSPGIENSIAPVPEPGTAGAAFLVLAAVFAFHAKGRFRRGCR